MLEDDITTQALFMTAAELQRKHKDVYKMFILCEADFDTDKANSIINAHSSITKFAEYLHIKFYDKPEQLGALINLTMNIILDKSPDREMVEKMISNLGT
jgi:hypothetical protein